MNWTRELKYAAAIGLASALVYLAFAYYAFNLPESGDGPEQAEAPAPRTDAPESAPRFKAIEE
jgi:hypothetical protein